MAPSVINVLLSTFPGLGLPQTLGITLPSSTTFADLHKQLIERLPPRLEDSRLSITTTSNEWLSPTSPASLWHLLPQGSQQDANYSFIPLRLTVPTLGGKGGFGSQLRAAGGRMASRKKNRNNQPVPNSNRNLDGRRLRTVGEAKALAEYLAVKPEMERKEKEERRKRWEDVVATTERREQEIKEGKFRAGNSRGDGAWVEEKADAETKVRDSIKEAMANGLLDHQEKADGTMKGSSEDSETGTERSESDSDEPSVPTARPAATGSSVDKGKARRVFGWDDDDEDASDSDEDANGERHDK